MNVSLQNIDKVSAELTVKLEKADYQEKVDKELKSLRQKAQIPGFRKGMVPTSLIKKMYGKSVIAEVVNKALQEAVYNYIKENKVNMLGEPLPNEEKQQNIDFDTMEEFDFVFDIALAPEFKAEVSAKDKVDYYTIEVSDEMIDNQVKMYTQRTGKYDKVDAYEDNDMLKGLLAQLLYLDSVDPGKDISIYINSPGGSVYAGLGIYDTMQFISSDVATICTGMAASMAAVLLVAGAEGKRSALPHSRVMIHQPMGGAQGQASDIEITAREIQKLKKELYTIIADHSHTDFDKVWADSDRDYWMTAQEAKEYGMIDEVLIKK